MIQTTLRLGAAALLAGGLWVHAAQAGFVDGADVPAMVEGSDLIVVGRAIGTHAQANGADGVESFVIAVDRTIKGAGGSRIAVRLDLIDTDATGVDENHYGMFFLRRAGGVAEAFDPDHPALAASRNGKSRGGDALSQVAGELAQSFLDARGDRASDQETAEALNSIPYAVSGNALMAVADSNQMPARLWAVNVLLSTAPPEAIDGIAPRYLKTIEPNVSHPSPQLGFTMAMLNHAIASHAP